MRTSIPILILLAAALVACSRPANEATTDLTMAAATGDVPAIDAGIAAGADIDQTNQDGATPLIIAALYGQDAVVKRLLDAGARLDKKNNDGATALHVAAFFGRLDVARTLLEAGADTQARNVRGERPIDTVSGEWNAGLRGLYAALGTALNLGLDPDQMQTVRPRMADLLREYEG